MTAFMGLGTYGNAVGVVTPTDHKLNQLGQVAKQSNGLIISGMFWRGSQTVVTGTASMTYSVASYTCVTSRGGTSGAVFGGNSGALSVATTAAPGSNSRIDIIYHWHREYSLDGVDSNPVIGVIQGTAAAVPVAPSLAAFPGAIEIARCVIPAGVTATNSGTTFTQTGEFTAMAGGLILCRNTSDRDGVAPYTANSWALGQIIVLLDSGLVQRYDGTTWQAVGTQPLVPTIAGTGGTSAVNAITGEVTFSGALTAINVYVPTASIALLSSAKYVHVTIGFSGTTAGTMTLQLVTGAGSPDTNNLYYANYSGQAASVAVPEARAVFTAWQTISAAVRKRRRHTFDVFNLAVAQPTEAVGTFNEDDTAGVNRINGSMGLTHDGLTVFGGFRIVLAGAGTISNGQITMEAHY